MLYGDAETLFRETLEVHRRVLGPEHPDTLAVIGGMGSVIKQQGRHAESEAIFRKLLEVQRRVSGPEHPETLKSMHNLAQAIKGQNRYSEAEAISGGCWTSSAASWDRNIPIRRSPLKIWLRQ